MPATVYALTSLAPSEIVADGGEPTAAFGDPTTAVRVLIVAALASVPFAILSIVDAGGGRIVWDNLHWTISAVAGAIAAGWSIRGTTGRTRAVRGWATAALVLWMIATLAWAWMNLAGGATVPSVADLAILSIIVPGIGVLVASVRDRLSVAEETAVYLDAALGFLFIGSLLIWTFGATVLTNPSAASIAALVYPTAFFGLGVAGLISLLAVGYPIAPRGPLALLGGCMLIGLAYVGWLGPMIDLTNPGALSSVLFTVGTLVVAYGAVTWRDERSTSVRYLTLARGATRTVAPTVASLLFLLVLARGPASVENVLHVAIFAASIVFIIRQGLLLRERTTMLTSVTTLTEENNRLVGELRAELERRAIDERRMIQASRAAAVGDLAAGVAHEVNNPLTGVLGFAELLIEEAAPDDPRRPDLETIRDEALRARQIVRALRDFARPRPPELVPTDLSLLVHQTIELIRYSMERRGITIREDLPPLEPILIDGSAVQQAVLNVLTNARQAMQDDGRLVVAVHADGEGRLITITDDGVGMDPATAQLAFEPFFSRREDPDDPAPGAGLGLSVSTGLIESHGGTIRINSAPGRGTTVEIRVPAGDAADVAGGNQVGMVG
jgi:signal transduction histidine kinase